MDERVSPPPFKGESHHSGTHPAAAHQAGRDRLVVVQTVAVTLVVVAMLFWLLSDVLLLLFAAILIACQLSGGARHLARWLHVPYALALALEILVGTSLVAVVVWWRGPALVSEARAVAGDIEQQIPAFWHWLGDSDWVKDASQRIQAYVQRLQVAGYAAGFATSTLGGLGSALLVAVAAIYFAASPGLYADGFAALTPRSLGGKTREVLDAVGSRLRWWFVGQFVDMVLVGLLSATGLWLLGVKLWATLGLIAGLCNFVPYVGALAGSLPAILVALSQGPQVALDAAILFAVVQTVEGNLIAPLIQKRTVDLPPVLTLFAQTVLGTLFGPVGLILATPLTAAAALLVQRVYVEGILDKTLANGPG